MMRFIATTILIQVVAIAVVCAIAWAAGCGDGQEVARQGCYARAEMAAWSTAEEWCFDAGFDWDGCPERERILDELRDRYRGCP
jgi:hypothetical protein